MCILLLESVVIDMAERTFTEVIEVVVQDAVVEQEEEQVECWSEELEVPVVPWDMCSVPLVSIAISLYQPPVTTWTSLHDDADEQDEEQVE